MVDKENKCCFTTGFVKFEEIGRNFSTLELLILGGLGFQLVALCFEAGSLTMRPSECAELAPWRLTGGGGHNTIYVVHLPL